MPDDEENFGGSSGLDFRKWWPHVQAKNFLGRIMSKKAKFIVFFLTKGISSDVEVVEMGANSRRGLQIQFLFKT